MFFFISILLLIVSVYIIYYLSASYDRVISGNNATVVVTNAKKYNDPIAVLDIPKVSDMIELYKPVNKNTTKNTTVNKNTTKKTTSNKTTKVKEEVKKAETEDNKFNLGKISIDNSFSKDIILDDGSYYYLNHDLKGNNNGIGMPIIDFRTNFDTKKTLIYAHSSSNRNGSSPFDFLHKYYSYGSNDGYAFYKKHPYITINYDNHTYKYQIFSVYISTANNEEKELSDGLEYFRVVTYTTENWNKKVNEYKSNSQYDTGVSVNGSDKILILQTCATYKEYSNKSVYYRANLVVMAKLINME